MPVVQGASVNVVPRFTGVSVAPLLLMMGGACGAQPVETTSPTLISSPSASVGSAIAAVPLSRLWNTLYAQPR